MVSAGTPTVVRCSIVEMNSQEAALTKTFQDGFVEHATRQLVDQLRHREGPMAEPRAISPRRGRLVAEAVGHIDRIRRDGQRRDLEARTLLRQLFGATQPETVGEAAWWATPLGVMCASAMVDADDAVVTAGQARQILEVVGLEYSGPPIVERSSVLRLVIAASTQNLN
jgi:hypothetical protein